MSASEMGLGEDRLEATSRLDHLYRGHRQWLVDFLRRRFGAEAAEDIAQEAFLRSIATTEDICRPRAFLATIASRAAVDRSRTEARQVATSATPLEDFPVLPDALEQVLLQQLLRELPRPVREVYLLCRVAGFTYPEVAERLGISVKRVEARMTEAHKRFAALMRD